jgi:lipopolysaccharide export system protein LptC
MNVTVSLDSGTHVWHATGGSSRESAFRVASRHSRLVRGLRRAIPISVAVVVAVYVLTSFFNPWNALSKLPSIAKLNVSGTKITMDAPRLAGYTRDGRSYELTAAAAAQDLKRPQFIELKDIRAKVELQDSGVVNVSADSGVYDNKSEVVTLTQNVLVTATSGQEIRLIEARLDIRKGHIVSDQPVEVLLSNGRIDAKQLEVTDNGDTIYFRGGVVMTMQGDVVPPGSAEARR